MTQGLFHPSYRCRRFSLKQLASVPLGLHPQLRPIYLRQ